MTLMMVIMSIVCLIQTLNRYIRLAESLWSESHVQPYMFQILEENLYDFGEMFHFAKYWLFLGWFQVMSVVSWLVSGNFR